MIGPKFRRFGGAVSVFGLLLAGGSALAQTVLSVEQMRAAAAHSLKTGQAAQADALSSALLTRDPNDLIALLIRTRAQRDMGELEKARKSAERAWKLSANDSDKYATALITAQVLSSQGKRTRAQLWLRRAVHHAPNSRFEAKAMRDFAYVKRRNPWSTQLSFTLAPNSNINNGSARDRSELNYALSDILVGQSVEYELSGSAQALSGLEMGGAVGSRYRFKESTTNAHDVLFGLSYRSFALTSGAKSQAPDVVGSDFAYGTASVGYGFQQKNMDGKGTFGLNLDAEQSWYGGAEYATYLTGKIQQSYRKNATQNYRFGLKLERRWGQKTPDLDSFGINGSLTHRFDQGNLGYAGLNLTTTRSNNAESEYAEVMLRGGYVLAQPVMGAALQFGIGAAYRDYEVSRHAREGRQDTRIFADITATFTEIDYYGFNPSVTVNASSTNSNIGLFDTRRLGVSVGIKSAF